LLAQWRDCYSDVIVVKRLSVWIAGVLCVALGATVVAAEVWTVAHTVRTTDQNGDGRPDVWRHFDPHGQLTEIDVDTNFDGQPDVQEFYERGALVRRESDRNFNGQADLIEEFDADTHGRTRSVIDVDFDGAADLLVLFRDGRPVFTKRAHAERSVPAAQPVVRTSRSGSLAPLIDPFDSETAVRTGHVAMDEPGCVGLATCGGLPMPRFAPVDRLPTTRAIGVADASFHPSALDLTRSSRAPPLA
jgi:hypothetical protein